MSEERLLILKMIAEGRITPEDGDRLLEALESRKSQDGTPIIQEEHSSDNCNDLHFDDLKEPIQPHEPIGQFHVPPIPPIPPMPDIANIVKLAVEDAGKLANGFIDQAKVAMADILKTGTSTVLGECQLEPGDSISIENINGDIRVMPADGNIVKVKAEVRGFQPHRLELKFMREANRVIPIIDGKVKCGDQASSLQPNIIHNNIDWFLEVPVNTGIDFKTVSGDVSVDGASGNLVAASVSGDVTASRCSGDIQLETASGDLHLTDCSPVVLRLTAVSGDIKADLSRMDRNGKAELKTVNGDIDVRLSGCPGANIKIETTIGGLYLNLPVSYTQNDSKTIIAAYNEGGIALNATTFNGDIKIV